MAGKASPSDYTTAHKERSRRDQNSKGQRRHARFHVISITATRQSVLVSSIIKNKKNSTRIGVQQFKGHPSNWFNVSCVLWLARHRSSFINHADTFKMEFIRMSNAYGQARTVEEKISNEILNKGETIWNHSKRKSQEQGNMNIRDTSPNQNQRIRKKKSGSTDVINW
jgi:hypothetical protein